MREVSGAVTRAAAAGVGEMPGAYLAALSTGGEHVGLSREQELQLGALGLLALALVRIPDLCLCCHVLEASDLDPSYERPPAAVIAHARGLAGAVLRLAYRALEANTLKGACAEPEVETTVRLTDAYTRADGLLANRADGLLANIDAGEGPWLLEQTRHGVWALGDATSATGEPNPAVLSERLVDAIARLLTVFMVVSQLTVVERPVLRLAGEM